MKLEDLMPLLTHDDIMVFDEKKNLVICHLDGVVTEIKNRESYNKHEVESINRGEYTFNVYLKPEIKEEVKMKAKCVSDIWYMFDEVEQSVTVMISDENGLDFSIAEIYVTDQENTQENLYDLAYEVAHDLGYVLQGEIDGESSKNVSL